MSGEVLATFNRLRPRLTRIAYRMLGSVAEADDMVQEAWLRWAGADHAAVRDGDAYLVRLLTRLCLDQLKSARTRRETYIGPWLPEPSIDPVDALEEGEQLTLALMLALERLSPLERAAFLLHDVFGQPFDAVAEVLERDQAACRQLAARARTHVRAAKPRFPVTAERGRDIADAFLAAAHGGDLAGLRGLLAADAVLYTDGGGRARAALNPVQGGDKVARFFAGIAAKNSFAEPVVLYRGLIDGLPGFLCRHPDGTLQTIALLLDGDGIAAVYITRNPDKLRHLAAVGEGALLGSSALSNISYSRRHKM
ncbi:sigma-70 family RNA polymerase sigma factor [Niveispirillum sp. SYP-B3756]|uniref:sigma-70 family RNA polymerase sigma factor n=1 Tax=Niveispirillum sp. SYP-B3756 TaxID=2662178 RepID=UPI0032B35CBB